MSRGVSLGSQRFVMPVASALFAGGYRPTRKSGP